MFRSRTIAALVVVVAAATACSKKAASPEASGSPSRTGDEAAVATLIEASVAAENAKDVDAFLALWTDAGLEQYDSGTREELEADASDFGQDTIEIVDIPEVEVDGDAATAVVHATVDSETSFAVPLYEVEFAAIREGDAWLLDGFEFKGGAPITGDVPTVDVTAIDYGFQISPMETTGDFAIRFENAGEEQHEISLFLGPDGVDAGTARDDLKDVDGESLENVPDGYEGTHIAFAEAGESYDLTFAAPLEPGTYVLACYIPKGGFGEEGPVDPEGAPHIELGMIDTLTVT